MPTLDPRSTALIVVDLQNDFLAPGGAYDRGGAVSPQARALPARVAPVARALRREAVSSRPASSRCGPTRTASP